MSLYLLLALSLCAAAYGLYWSANRAGAGATHSAVFAGCAVVAFLLGWAFRGGGAAPDAGPAAPVAAPVVVATPNPALFHEAISALQFPSRVAAATVVNGTVVVQNTRALTWPTRNGPVYLGFRTLTADGRVLKEGRALLGNDLKPGEKRRVSFAALSPDVPGQYTLKVDVVYEKFSWFESSLNRPVVIALTVT